MTRVEAEETAYRQVGSSPCEDCDKFEHCRQCCGDLLNYKRAYYQQLAELLKVRI